MNYNKSKFNIQKL